jgi:hypothetical protein
MKNFNDTFWNRNLPVCSAVPQPTAPPRTLQIGVSQRFHTTFTSLRLPVLRQDSNTQSQKARAGRLKHSTARTTGSAKFFINLSFASELLVRLGTSPPVFPHVLRLGWVNFVSQVAYF